MTKISYKNLLPTVAGIVSYIFNFIDLNPFEFEFFIAFYAIFPVIYVLWNSKFARCPIIDPTHSICMILLSVTTL